MPKGYLEDASNNKPWSRTSTRISGVPQYVLIVHMNSLVSSLRYPSSLKLSEETKVTVSGEPGSGCGDETGK
jgi:hypothetical protein